MNFRRQSLVIAVLVLCILWTAVTAFADFSVDFLDVGAGDCLVVQSDGHAMMIDTGPGTAWKAVDSFLTDAGLLRIDTLLLTHFHPDHTANLDRLLSTRIISEVLYSAADTEAFSSWPVVLEESGIGFRTLSRGDGFLLGSAVCDVLWPYGEPTELVNDHSVVLKITCHGFTLLLMGDAESETERWLLSLAGPDELKADLIKLGHHGMDTSSSWPLIRAVSPVYAVASCAGPDHNSSLSPIVSETLSECGVQYILTTAAHGTVRLKIDDSGLLTIR